MIAGLSDENLLRIIIGLAFLVLIAFIVFNNKRKPSRPGKSSAVRSEPGAVPLQDVLRKEKPVDQNGDFTEQGQMEFEADENEAVVDSAKGKGSKAASAVESNIGKRRTDQYEKLVMLYLAAKSGQMISGAELVLATEKVGLVYGHHQVYHRLAEGSGSSEPVFSMANVIQPGYFDLRQIDQLQTPGVSFFMTLPGPVTAVRAWETMLPIAERMAQLLDAVLLDSDRNALGRQRILHIKEELRSFDREKERQQIKPGR